MLKYMIAEGYWLCLEPEGWMLRFEDKFWRVGNNTAMCLTTSKNRWEAC
ncbi:MAG: hypothetical protein V3W44_09810 [Dehalococcoidales bacterium]